VDDEGRRRELVQAVREVEPLDRGAVGLERLAVGVLAESPLDDPREHVGMALPERVREQSVQGALDRRRVRRVGPHAGGVVVVSRGRRPDDREARRTRRGERVRERDHPTEAVPDEVRVPDPLRGTHRVHVARERFDRVRPRWRVRSTDTPRLGRDHRVGPRARGVLPAELPRAEPHVATEHDRLVGVAGVGSVHLVPDLDTGVVRVRHGELAGSRQAS